MFKPIETRYKGYRFRSRLEARWAYYFDLEKLRWEYELQPYYLGNGVGYLSDFWLPQVHMWAEVKPERFTEAELDKAWGLFNGTGHPVLFLVGAPAIAAYKYTAYVNDDKFGSFCTRCYKPGKPFEPCVGCVRGYDDAFVSSYHCYPQEESRFYTCTGESSIDDHMPTPTSDWAEEILRDSVYAARAARFDHGETPRVA